MQVGDKVKLSRAYRQSLCEIALRFGENYTDLMVQDIGVIRQICYGDEYGQYVYVDWPCNGRCKYYYCDQLMVVG